MSYVTVQGIPGGQLPTRLCKQGGSTEECLKNPIAMSIVMGMFPAISILATEGGGGGGTWVYYAKFAQNEYSVRGGRGPAKRV